MCARLRAASLTTAPFASTGQHAQSSAGALGGGRQTKFSTSVGLLWASPGRFCDGQIVRMRHGPDAGEKMCFSLAMVGSVCLECVYEVL